MDQAAADRKVSLAAVAALIAAGLLAALVGVGAGMVIAALQPHDKFTWLMVLLIPIYVGLEWLFELSVAVLGFYSKIVRVVVMVAMLGGFYVTWFILRPL